MPNNYLQAPILKSYGEKSRNNKWGKAIRTHELESIIFRGIPGKCGAQLKLMLFFTGNATDGSFAVAEQTVIDRCGISESTYKKARKALVEKGWIIHNAGSGQNAGEIIVDYDAIYKSAEEFTEDTPIKELEDSPKKSEYPPQPDIENTYNNISTNITHNKNRDIIKSQEQSVIGIKFDDNNFVF